ncbi:MAG: ROK family protein [Methanobacterium sp. ERen5]|nr:MAG: ROK family protein [Methanobacterium sp. ERen5]
MMTVAIVKRKLKPGKTYEDFRKAWYHTVGFGASTRMYTAINVFDPTEIIVMGFVESEVADFMEGLKIDVNERLENPLDDIIEPDIVRQFGMVVSEDDFSPAGAIEYKDASIENIETNMQQVYNDISKIAKMIETASAERDELKKRNQQLK